MGNHSQPSRAQEHIVNQTNYLGKAAQHVLQQLNHFPTSSRSLFFGWREIVERLACRDGSSQHRGPWTTLTTHQQWRYCGTTGRSRWIHLASSYLDNSNNQQRWREMWINFLTTGTTGNSNNFKSENLWRKRNQTGLK